MINATNAATFGKHVTFEQYLDVIEKLETMGREIVWPEGVGSGAMGLTPDHIKFSPEYRAARNRSEQIKDIIRKFNSTAAPRFKKEMRARIDAKRAAKLAAMGE